MSKPDPTKIFESGPATLVGSGDKGNQTKSASDPAEKLYPNPSFSTPDPTNIYKSGSAILVGYGYSDKRDLNLYPTLQKKLDPTRILESGSTALVRRLAKF